MAEESKSNEELSESDIANLETRILQSLAERARDAMSSGELVIESRNQRSDLKGSVKGDAHDRDSSTIRLRLNATPGTGRPSGTRDFDKDPHDKDPHDKDPGNFDRNNVSRDNFSRNG